MPNTICFIPARGGSKSIPKKNIKILGDKPLIAYSIKSAFDSGVQKVIVSTEDDEIAEVAREYGAEVLKRPLRLAGNNTSMFDVLKSEIPKITKELVLVLLLQPTTPFRGKIHTKVALSMLPRNLEEYDSLISVEKVPEKYNPAVVIVQSQLGKGIVMGKVSKMKTWLSGKKWTEPTISGIPIAQRITRRQDHPTAWIPDGSIYLFKSENLKKGSIYGENVMLLEKEGTININDQADWEKAEAWITKNSQTEN